MASEDVIPVENSSYAPGRRGYPLGALFVLVTICAVLTAAITPAVRAVMEGKLELWQLSTSAGAGFVSLGIVGAAVGVIYFLHVRGLLLGGIAGGLVGLIAGPMVLVKTRDLLPMAIAMLVGSALAVMLAMGMRGKRGD